MKRRKTCRYCGTLAAVLCLGLIAVLAVSCGGGDAPPAGAEAAKYPPGTSEEMLAETTGDAGLVLEGGEETAATEEEEMEDDTGGPPAATLELAGARFTVVEASRQGSNADAITSGQREVEGDYLEIELLVENIGDDLVDLSEFSFRIWSEGIAADDYADYYRTSGAFGAYVSENMISAVLLDYATLQPAAYTLKMGETVDGVFLFYDLNPKNTARNQGISKEGTNLVIYKERGDDAGEQVEANLAGYPD
ncbi:MAG: hypothetical protein AB1384_03550 [Actinomycetota bacterium]